jgi:hypothetical protein
MKSPTEKPKAGVIARRGHLHELNTRKEIQKENTKGKQRELGSGKDTDRPHAQ